MHFMETANEQYSSEENEEEDWRQDDISTNVQGHHERCIVHIDIDCFYAQVETLTNPSLKDKPVGIQQKNIIVTCNYKARECGLTKLMYLKDAKEKCKDLVIVNGEDLTKYREMSEKIFHVIRKFSPTVEKLGMDENFIDVTSMCSVIPWKDIAVNKPAGLLYGSSKRDCSCGCTERLTIGSHIAKEIRQTLNEELGITSCAGISYNKLLAKLVGSVNKPNQQTVLYPGNEQELMNGLGSVRKIPGIGSSTSKRLTGMGILSVSDLNECALKDLEKEFGITFAKRMKELTMGADFSSVLPTGKPQSMSDEDSFKRCDSVVDAKNRITSVTSSLLTRVLNDGRIPQTLRLSIRKFDPKRKYFGRESRQCPIPPAIFQHSNIDVEKICNRLVLLTTDLFKKMVDEKNPFHLTLLNVCLTKFTDTSAKSGGIRAFLKSKEDSPGEQWDVMDFSDSGDTSEGECENVVVESAFDSMLSREVKTFKTGKSKGILTVLKKCPKQPTGEYSFIASPDSLNVAETCSKLNLKKNIVEGANILTKCDTVVTERDKSLEIPNHKDNFCNKTCKEKSKNLSFFKRKAEIMTKSPIGKKEQSERFCMNENGSFSMKRTSSNVDNEDRYFKIERKPSKSSSDDIQEDINEQINYSPMNNIKWSNYSQDEHSKTSITCSESSFSSSTSLLLQEPEILANNSSSEFDHTIQSHHYSLCSHQTVQAPQAKPSETCTIPPGIDCEVFMLLPAAVQREVIADYKAQAVGKEFEEMKANKSPAKSKTLHKGKQSLSKRKSAQKNIATFFKKK